MSRRLKEGVLQTFIKFTENTEIPSIFSLWVGVSTISAALGRDCFIDFGHVTIFPNMYIVLVAGSAKCRKSTAIGVGRKLIEKVNPKIQMLSQKMTPEALIGALCGLRAGGETSIVNEAEGIIITDELSTLIDRNAFKSGMIPVLTKLYDGEDFQYETKSRGIELVRNPCLSMLGGSTTQWIRESIPTVAIGGGFTSRVIFVFRDTYERIVAWPKMTEDNIKRGNDLVHDLSTIAKMRGGFILTENAHKVFESEYRTFMEKSHLFADPNLSGYAGRRHTMLLKVAMTVSASSKDTRVITPDDLAVAINALRMAEKDMPKVLQAIRTEFVGDVCEQILNIIITHKVVSRAELIKLMRHRLSVRDVDCVLDTLMEIENDWGKKIVTVRRDGANVSYVYTGDQR